MNRLEPNRNVYIGHRYVPLLVGEWDKSIQYEGLSIVTFKGNSYTSKKMTPAGIDIENEEYWVLTGNYNAQIEYYREETERVSDELDTKSDKTYVDTELGKKSDKTYVDTELGKKSDKTYVDTELGKKSDKTYVDNELDKKSDITYVDTELDKKLNKEELVFNVKDYGAVGDGVTDDTPAFTMALEKVEEKGGGKIIFPPGGNYRLSKGNLINDNGVEYVPDNTHIVCTGSYFKALDDSLGHVISLTNTINSSITGGIFDGNWDGGLGIDKWDRANGVISDDGRPGNQSPVGVSYSENCFLENVKAVNAVNDGISGGYNKNLNLYNCEALNSSEHGFYFSYSEYVYLNNCKSTNSGLNNWDKGSVMVKMRESIHFYINNFYGINTDTKSRAGLTEGTGSHLYINDSHFINVSAGIYFNITPNYLDNTNNNIHISNTKIIGIGDNQFISIVDRGENCSLNNVFISNFERVPLFDDIKNVTIEKCGGDGISCITTEDNKINIIKDLIIKDCSGRMSINGLPNSMYEDIIIYGDNVPIESRIYSEKSFIKNIKFIAPENNDFTSQRAFYLNSSNIFVDGIYSENIPTLFMSNTTSKGIFKIKNAHIINGSSIFRDTGEIGNDWYFYNVTAESSDRVLHGTDNGSEFNYHNVLKINTTDFKTDLTNAIKLIPE